MEKEMKKEKLISTDHKSLPFGGRFRERGLNRKLK